MKSKYNSHYCYQHTLPGIQQNICSSSRRKTLNGILLHRDNEPALNSRLSSEKIESAKAQRWPHPPYGSDPAPSDFFLFGYLKEKLCGTSFTTSEDQIFAIWPFFLECRNGTETCVHKLDHETVLGDEERWRILQQISKKNQILRIG
jgi:hypothetical protein